MCSLGTTGRLNELFIHPTAYKYYLSDLSMIVAVVNDTDDLFVAGDVSPGCGWTSEHGRGSLDMVVD